MPQILSESDSAKVSNKIQNVMELGFIERLKLSQQNPIKEILDNKNENKITILLAYLIILALFGLAITYAITTFKDIIAYGLRDKKIATWYLLFPFIIIFLALKFDVFFLNPILYFYFSNSYKLCINYFKI